MRMAMTLAKCRAGMCLFSGLLVLAQGPKSSGQTVSDTAYGLINSRAAANQASFYVYQDQDSGLNHGFPSGFFGNIGTTHVDSGCIDDPAQSGGCSTDPNRLDVTRGTVLKIAFDAQGAGSFAGVNIEEPENWGMLRTGQGYDLRGSANVVFNARSPDSALVQFGVDGCVTQYMQLLSTWTTYSIPLSSLGPCTSDSSGFAAVHILFAVGTNDLHAPSGAIVLLDNIRFEPVPTAHAGALGFALGNQTFGVLPAVNSPIPSDQVLRNLTTIYESALVELTLLLRGNAGDLANARLTADTFDYVLHHDNHGDALPVASDDSVAAHNGYESGDIGLFNNQSGAKTGMAGDVRLAGYTAPGLCPLTGFCLVQDGASGGNNAFAILALLGAYERFHDLRYLNDARMIGRWIILQLSDGSGTGYGGYFVGYPDMGVPPPKPLQTGKSTENNSDIYAAFRALATIESRLGNAAAAASWTTAANAAGDFVMQMFDSTTGRFNAGTVPSGASGPGICPTGPQKGNDVINTCDFLDSNTFSVLALAGSPRYRTQIDWRRPVQYAVTEFAQTITAGGQTFSGFNIVPSPVSGPNGVAWEFTAQVVLAMRFVDLLYGDLLFQTQADLYNSQIAAAQRSAPFGDGLGLVASTLQDGDVLQPIQQCLNTPFQCIAERVGLAATTWAILADWIWNPFITPAERIRYDFDGNGVPDLVWQNDTTSQIVVWYMGGAGGATFQGFNWLDPAGHPGWHVVAVADFNRDGFPDLVWQDDDTRQVTVWYLGGAGGATFQGYNWLSQSGVPGWHVVAAADFNGDGVPDLVWQNDTTRQVTVWYMSGTGGATFQSWTYLSASGVPGWHVVAAADFNGDGVPDLVWQNDTTRQVTVWYMGGAGGATFQNYNWLSQSGVPGWHVVAAADFNGDGVPDLVWQNDTTRQVTVWYMGGAGGATFQSFNWLDMAGHPGWSLVQ